MSHDCPHVARNSPVRPQYYCLRCLWRWFGRSANRPIRCPRCRSFTWDRPPSCFGPDAEVGR
jgi:hypothetical protein